MFTTLSELLGGVGMFLLGMSLMSEGLKSFAGDSLRKSLLAFTGQPITAFLSGIGVTAIIQSSSATTLMTIGFVSAGVLPFSQSIGVLMGASLGTTSTGWIVSIIGLSVSVSSFALFFVAAGSATRLFIKGRGNFLGSAIAGFGLIFLGIGLLQTGMGRLTSEVDLSILPSGGFLARVLALGIGVILTTLMQSCSAVMATNMMALSAGAINFEQSASLAIGAAIGTTVTAGIASIGASLHAKRTALALAAFNISTGLLALFLMPVLLGVIYFLQRRVGLEEGAVSLAVFHSMFIALGVCLFLPFVRPYGALIERLLPGKETGFTRFLDKSLLNLPPVALEAIGRSLRECRDVLAATAASRIRQDVDAAVLSKQSAAVMLSIGEIRTYLTAIEVEPEDHLSEARRIGDIHIMDHLQRLASAIPATEVHPGSVRLQPWEERFANLLTGLTDGSTSAAETTAFAREVADWRQTERGQILGAAAKAGANATDLLCELDTLQWLDQVAHHLARVEFYFAQTPGEEA